MPSPTPYEDVNALLADLLASQQEILGDKLKALYLYGSLVWGDFDHACSDVDMLAVVDDGLSAADYAALEAMHAALAERHPVWEGRIEVQYASVGGLATYRQHRRPMAVISPGEPFHVIEAGVDWLTNWYFVQDYGVTLFGPEPSAFISPISKDEFLQAVYDHAIFWRGHVEETRFARGYQSYAVLTLCRAWHALVNREQVSKHKAAQWAKERLPQWADWIDTALLVRTQAGLYSREDAEAAFPETRRFVEDLVDRIRQMKQ